MLYVLRLTGEDLYEAVQSGAVLVMRPEGLALTAGDDSDGETPLASAGQIDRVTRVIGGARAVVVPTTARDLVRAWRDGCYDAIVVDGMVYGPLEGDMATRRAADGAALVYQGGAWIMGTRMVSRPRHCRPYREGGAR